MLKWYTHLEAENLAELLGRSANSTCGMITSSKEEI